MHNWFYSETFEINLTRECGHCHRMEYFHPAQVWIVLVDENLFQSQILRIRGLECQMNSIRSLLPLR